MPLLATRMRTAGSRAAIITYKSTWTDNTSASSYSGGSWSGVSIGAARHDRFVIFGIFQGGNNSATISGATIGGVAATQLVQTNTGVGGCGIFYRRVPTGTTVDFTVTLSASKSRAHGAVWTLYGLGTSPSTDTDSSIINSGTMSVQAISAGALFGISYHDDFTDASCGWAELTEDFDESPNSEYSGASKVSMGGTANVSATWTNSSGSITSCLASLW